MLCQPTSGMFFVMRAPLTHQTGLGELQQPPGDKRYARYLMRSDVIFQHLAVYQGHRYEEYNIRLQQGTIAA